ncbi:3-dehydroquinate dehydratase [Proteiniborus ethanoligenes]|uniref:3-dehydroquinate dehydratase n=1 Tax=Proteiniborus ethanoligenes TaxID=415015 RepID=A0A1H3Q003_9FIRM|nr:type II 3-dehydroquinate dehydratase [Proteiniborus ethanoligenes]TAH64107.1 MAG: type II 3-dehydroquinate dehydratase [Gottschalkiaceae bacterium]SDZ06395.1 3-dehydroquinate dehydratase [Proteiniborus ethanoligenes]
MKILIVNGPNINLLGIREKDIYGSTTYDKLCKEIENSAKEFSLDIDIVHSNVEGEIINYIQNALGEYDGIIINPGAYTHYSIAIYDALKAVSIPTIEVHISNIYNREEYRRKSVIAPACIGQITGFGVYGYTMAMMGLKEYLEK